MVLAKNRPFFPRFVLGNIGQEVVFYDILEQKNRFLRYKNKKLKSRKSEIFLKGLVHGFGQKLAIFSTFCFREYRPGKCVLRYSRTKKKGFLRHKAKKLRKLKN